MSPVTKMIIGFTVAEVLVRFIISIEIVRNMVSGVCRHPTPTGTELPHTPGFDNGSAYRILFPLPVVGLPVLCPDCLRTGNGDGGHTGHPHCSAIASARPGYVLLRFFHLSGPGGSLWTLGLLPPTIIDGTSGSNSLSHKQVAFTSP